MYGEKITMSKNYIERKDGEQTRVFYFEMQVKDYLAIAEEYRLLEEKLDNQRKLMVNTRLTRKISEKLARDIQANREIPPIILGWYTKSYKSKKTDEILSLKINKNDKEQLFIVDGQHRTQSLQDTSETYPEVKNHKILISLFLTENKHSLFERMMVLNIGQIPWNAKQQAKAIFRFYLNSIENNEIAEESNKDPYNFLEHFFVYRNTENEHSYEVNIKEELDLEYSNVEYLEDLEHEDKAKEQTKDFESVYLIAKELQKVFVSFKESASIAYCYMIKDKKYTNEDVEKIKQWIKDTSSDIKTEGDAYAYMTGEKNIYKTIRAQIGPTRKKVMEFILEVLFDKIIKEDSSDLDHMIDDSITRGWKNYKSKTP
jgi:hypothetical protein